MPDLNGTLDSVLAFVTIVLVLSLIIQSLQNIIKRLLMMKSRQAEQSLRLLFDYVLNRDPSKYTSMKYASPILHAATKLTGDERGITESLVKAVKDEVLEVGRKSFWGNPILDSVTKEDLTRILSKLPTDPNVDEKVKQAIDGKIEEIRDWYDTVMPGLAERHERGMKWLAVLLSAIVVVLFNADAIKIYTYVSSDDVVQQQLIDYAKKRTDERAKQQSAQSESASQQDLDQLKTEIAQTKGLVEEYRKFGLTPFKWDGFGTASTRWRMLLGWFVMTLLLGMGAPFWEDALGSLFGLKNTLSGKGKQEQKKQQ